MLTLKLAARNLFRNYRRTLLTVLSMTVGYWVLVATLSLTEGSYQSAIDLFTTQQTGHAQVSANGYLDRPGLHKTVDQYQQVIEKASNDERVQSVSARIFASVLSYGESKSYPAQLVGIDTGIDKELLSNRLSHGANRLAPNQEDYYGVVIGHSLAQQVELGVGGELVLISEGLDGSIANDIFIVQGIIDSKYQSDGMRVYMSLESAQQYLALYEKVHQLVVRLNSPSVAREYASDMRARLPSDLEVEPWQIVEETFYKSMQADKAGGHFAVAIVMIIVSVAVLNTILMSVLERTREFGVLMALGTPTRQIVGLIMIESSLLAFAAVSIGFVTALPANIYLENVGFALSQPVEMGGVQISAITGQSSVYTLGLPAVVVVLATLVVALIPAYRIAKQSPLSAMEAV